MSAESSLPEPFLVWHWYLRSLSASARLKPKSKLWRDVLHAWGEREADARSSLLLCATSCNYSQQIYRDLWKLSVTANRVNVAITGLLFVSTVAPTAVVSSSRKSLVSPVDVWSCRPMEQPYPKFDMEKLGQKLKDCGEM